MKCKVYIDHLSSLDGTVKNRVRIRTV